MNWQDRHAEDFRIYREIMRIPAEEQVPFGVLFSNWIDSSFPRMYLFACIDHAGMTPDQVLAAIRIYRPNWVEHLPNLIALGQEYAELYETGRDLRMQSPLNWIAIREHREREGRLMWKAENGDWRGVQA